jgi:tripartite tricarboxylate transporter TctA family protein
VTIEGVAGPESANNAGAQSSFIPMLTLGIPPNAVMALMVGAMTIHGIVPGPLVMTKNATLFWGMIASMWVGNPHAARHARDRRLKSKLFQPRMSDPFARIISGGIPMADLKNDPYVAYLRGFAKARTKAAVVENDFQTLDAATGQTRAIPFSTTDQYAAFALGTEHGGNRSGDPDDRSTVMSTVKAMVGG